MCLRFVFLLALRIPAWMRLSRRPAAWKDTEILLLRHQIALLQRQATSRPRLTWADRALIAALLAVIPRRRNGVLHLPVTPAAILRWHCDLVKRRWAAFVHSQAEAILAIDFVLVDLLDGTKAYVLAVIEHASRRVRIPGITLHPTRQWVAQQARNLLADLDVGVRVRFLIHDRDAIFHAGFDEVFTVAGIEVIRTGVRAPRQNAVMERRLVIFYPDASHVGTYAGNGKVVVAPHTGTVAKIEQMRWMPIYDVRRPG